MKKFIYPLYFICFVLANIALAFLLIHIYKEQISKEIQNNGFPTIIYYQGEKYISTGKEGVNSKTGTPSVNYQTSQKYLWLDKNGNITSD